MEIVEIEGEKFVKIGDWLFDAFLAKNGSVLGITVYEPKSNPHEDRMDDAGGKCVDIFIDNAMRVKSF